jgi:hypothetical protein
MKNTSYRFIGILFIATIFTSCGLDIFNGVVGNSNVVITERTIKADFSGIKVSTGIDLFIRQGSTNAITVEADENLHDLIITEVKEGILKIYTDKNIWKAKARKVYVTIENLTLLKASSGSNVKSESVINTNEIYIDASSGASIDIEVVAKSAVTEASSGSSINAYKLKSTNANASASSGASINIYASKNMDAKASSGGAIDYTGNPTKISKEASSGGSISIN